MSKGRSDTDERLAPGKSYPVDFLYGFVGCPFCNTSNPVLFTKHEFRTRVRCAGCQESSTARRAGNKN
jgi:transposase-like protein